MIARLIGSPILAAPNFDMRDFPEHHLDGTKRMWPLLGARDRRDRASTTNDNVSRQILFVSCASILNRQ